MRQAALRSERGPESAGVDASICARPLFEKVGFKVTRENIVTIDGVDLLNFKMELLR